MLSCLCSSNFQQCHVTLPALSLHVSSQRLYIVLVKKSLER